MERVEVMTPRSVLESPSRPPYDRTGHLISEFSQGVANMAEMEDEKLDIGSLVQSLVVALRSEARAKPHPILYVNLAFVMGLVFSCGVLWNRVETLEARAQAIEVKAASIDTIQVVNAKVDTLTNEVDRIRDKIDGMKRK
jgi:hypothetical protein